MYPNYTRKLYRQSVVSDAIFSNKYLFLGEKEQLVSSFTSENETKPRIKPFQNQAGVVKGRAYCTFISAIKIAIKKKGNR